MRMSTEELIPSVPTAGIAMGSLRLRLSGCGANYRTPQDPIPSDEHRRRESAARAQRWPCTRRDPAGS